VITLVDCWLPYGDTEVYVSIELDNHLGTLKPLKISKEESISLENEINTALNNPLNSPTLPELIDPNSLVTIAVDGTMNPHLAVEGIKIITHNIVDLISTREKLTILIGNGERENSGGKIFSALKDNVSFNQIKLLNNTKNSSNHINIGKTSKGTPLEIRREYVDSSIKIAIGQTQIDPFTGFKGAFTAIIPGISSRETIEAIRKNYFGKDIHPGKIEENPIKEDIHDAIGKVGISLALNFTVDYDGKMLGVTIGDYKEVWREAVNHIGNSYEVGATDMADITIISAGGLSYDFNLYKSIWALHNAAQVTKRNGIIILVAECIEGLGAEAFKKLSRVTELSEFERRYTYGAEALRNLKQIQQTNKIILVSALPSYLTDPLELESATTLNEGYKQAIDSRRGRKTLVIPYGCTSRIKTL
jgi:nickel-dependent lactate racemase